MTTVDTSLRGWEIAFASLFVALAAVFSFFASQHGSLVLLVPVGLLIVALVIWRPFIGVIPLIAMAPLENLFIVGGSMTGIRLLGIIVAGAWAIHRLLSGESWRPLLASGLFVAAGMFVALAFASVLWARDSTLVLRGSFQLLQLFVLGLLIADLVSSWTRLDAVVKALMLGGMVAAALTLWQFFGLGMSRAGEMIAGGINATAAVLVILVPFGFYLLRASHQTRSTFWRVYGVVFVVLAILASAVTFARMSFLVLPPLLLILLWHTGKSRKARGWLLGLATIGALVLVKYIPWELVEERAATIAPYLSSDEETRGYARPPTYSGRIYHLKIGLAIAEDHPFLGAGYNHYGELFRSEYQFEVVGGRKVWGSRRSSHSSYPGILADLGLVGLLLWLLVLGVAVRNVLGAWRATRGKPNAPGSPTHIMVQALTYGVLLHVLAYSWYMPNQKDKLFWMLLGISVAVLRLGKKGCESVTLRAGDRRPR